MILPQNFVPLCVAIDVDILPFTRAIQKDVWILSECFCTVWTVWRDFSSKNVVKIIRRSNARNTFPMSNTVFHFSLYQKWVKNLKKSKLKKKRISVSWMIFKVCKNSLWNIWQWNWMTSSKMGLAWTLSPQGCFIFWFSKFLRVEFSPRKITATIKYCWKSWAEKAQPLVHPMNNTHSVPPFDHFPAEI